MFDVVGAIKGVTELADDLWTSKEEEMRIAIEGQRIDAELAGGQMAINAEEAKHKKVFIAGWRPFIGWVCGIALAYNFLFYPLLGWAVFFAKSMGWMNPDLDVSLPILTESEQLNTVLFGMLGLGGLRTYEKYKGITK